MWLAYSKSEHFNDHTFLLFFALMIKQNNSSAVESKVYPFLRSALDQ